MVPQFRFTVFHSVVSPTGTVVPQPLGWKQAKISQERDKVYHSLVEYFKGTFIWYGSARTLLQTIESAHGVEAEVRVLIEIHFGNGFETVFDGTIDLGGEEEISKGATFYKTSAPIIRNSFWVKFMNRKSIPVPLSSTTDLDGGTRAAVAKKTLPLPSQVISVNSDYTQTSPALIGTLYDSLFSDPSFQVDIDTNHYINLDNDTELKNEINSKFQLPLQPTGTTIPVNMFKMLYTGQYVFDLKFCLTWVDYDTALVTNEYRDLRDNALNRLLRIYIKVNNETPIEFNITDQEQLRFPSISLYDRWTEYEYSGTLDLNAGDEVTVYGQFVGAGSFGYGYNGITRKINQLYMLGSDNSTIEWSGGVTPLEWKAGAVDSHITVAGSTTYVDTTTDGFLIRDAAESILSKLVGADSVITSSLFDATIGPRLNFIAKGKHYRGYPFSEKDLFMSWDDWWSGANPLVNLGLGYTTVDGVEKFVLESKEHFYDKSPVVYFKGITDMVRTNALELFYKSTETGFQVWSAESEGGFDDPQTKVTRRTKFGNIGKDEKILSTWIAASLAIEQTRRNRVEAGKDWRLDENYLVVAVKPNGLEYTPELGSDFNLITNLLNSDTRYNVRHTSGRVFKRWQKWLQSCLHHTAGENFTFTSGEGNYKTTSQFDVADYEATDDPEPILAEDQNIAVDETQYVFIPKLVKVKTPMKWTTYKTIRQNSTKAIGISQGISLISNSYLPMFIMDLDYSLVGGFADMLLLQADKVEIEVEENGIFDFTFDGTFE